MKQHHITLSIAVIAVVSIILNISTWSKPSNEQKYPLLAKRLFVSSPNDLLINFTSLREDLRKYIDKSDHKIGVYFEYLPTGISININGNDDYYRASLVKLPGVMRTYKLIEDGKLQEQEQLEVKPYHLNNFGENKDLKVGMKKTVGELSALALRDSNNTAYEIIYEKVNGDILKKEKGDEETINNVYNYLDIPTPGPDQTLFISPKNYSSALKSLYFSSYLNYADSSKLLDHLTHSSFNDWLPKNLPKDLLIAHKFGIFDLNEPANYKVHSDCGIVYLPKRPYLLCVMGQQANNDNLGADIADISKIVYDFLTKN
ncbi:MAG: serine hydrolase [Candidatus Berkelbacteria bacterium]|nr:MAG: serine hydrolase [Candidatus Berkelbacteria bacterium]QQG51529.1 MAG: serine hydrolase [Candidatus Berkelbacteria bacterium]